MDGRLFFITDMDKEQYQQQLNSRGGVAHIKIYSDADYQGKFRKILSD